MVQQVTYTNEVDATLSQVLASTPASQLFVIVDTNTARLVLPQLNKLRDATVITIAAGDTNKTINTVAQVWLSLSQSNATRQSAIVNLGGGMVTDLGGFAAATFKRGIRFVNVPTTLLGAVDAAVGGKTGVNFNGLKNEVGVFAEASDVIVSSCFFDTLPNQEFLSGYAEMIKHGMLHSCETFNSLIRQHPSCCDTELVLRQLQQSIHIKQSIVEQDPQEHGIRRTLNWGHTVGHALESLAMRRNNPVPHGYAVAWGMVVESVLSHIKHKFPSEELHQLATFVKEHYGVYPITCDDYPELLDLMHHDKKSHHGEINCTLLVQCGNASIDNTIEEEDMRVALDIFRDLMGS